MHGASPDFLQRLMLALEYPGIGARSVVQRDRAFVHAFGELGSQAGLRPPRRTHVNSSGP
ncbi:MAG: hypothetical protein JWM98_1316 [Thermoleophilia bacterium]|nr:hypothetical protein [Thermoleophilia bacterium]